MSVSAGAACAEGRPEKGGRDAGDVLDGLLTGAQLFTDARPGEQGEVGVGLGVISDLVTFLGDAAGECRVFSDVIADEEEGGARVVAGEQVEQGGRVAGAWAVIVGEDDGGVRGIEVGAVDPGAAEEPGFRPHTAADKTVGAAKGDEAPGNNGSGDFGIGDHRASPYA